MIKRISHLIKLKNGKLFRITKLFIIFLGLYYVVSGKSSDYFYINSNLPKDIYLLDTPPPILEDFELDIPDTRLGLREYGNPINFPFEISELDTLYNIWKTENASIIMNEWIKRYDPIIEYREISTFIFWDCDSFYLRSDNESFNKIVTKTDLLESGEFCSYNFWSKYISSINNYNYLTSTTPIEEIWDDNSLSFTNHKLKSSDQKVCELLNGLQISHDTSLKANKLLNPESWAKVITYVNGLKNDSVRCYQMFMLWHFLYENQIFLIENQKRPSILLEQMLIKSTSLSYYQKATWYVALAKLIASSNLKQEHLIVEEYLDRAFYYMSKNDILKNLSYSDEILSIELLRARLWDFLKDEEYGTPALNICFDQFLKYRNYLTNTQIEKLYSNISYYQSVNLLRRQLFGIPTTDLYYLQCLNNVLHSFLSKNTRQNWKIYCSDLITISNLFRSKNDFKSSIIANYMALYKLCFQDPDDILSNGLLLEIIYRIFEDNIELNDHMEIKGWFNLLKTDTNTFELSSNDYRSKYVNNWSKNQIDSFVNWVLTTPIQNFNFVSVFDQKINQANINYVANKIFILGEKDNAFRLKLKADTLITKSINYSFGLGHSMAEAKRFVLTEELNSKNDSLKKSLNSKQEKLNEVNNQVVIAQRILLILNDSIITVDSFLKLEKNLKLQAEQHAIEEKARREQLQIAKNRLERALFIRKILLGITLFAFVLTGFFSYRNYRLKNSEKKLRFEANRNALMLKFKANIWQEFGHIPGSLIDSAYQSLKNHGVSTNELHSLLLLESLIALHFKSLKDGTDNMIVEIGHEIKLCIKYIEYKIMVSGMKIDFEIGSFDEKLKIPPAILLSVIKNAIQHGRQSQGEPIRIKLEILEKEQSFNCVTYDDGGGFELKIISILDIQGGTGLKNINEILCFHNKNEGTFVDFGTCNIDGFNNIVNLTINKL